MSKDKAIEIVQNLTKTINTYTHKNIIRKTDNEMFHHPSACKKMLKRKKDDLIKNQLYYYLRIFCLYM